MDASEVGIGFMTGYGGLVQPYKPIPVFSCRFGKSRLHYSPNFSSRRNVVNNDRPAVQWGFLHPVKM
jgi:hypothetical protein